MPSTALSAILPVAIVFAAISAVVTLSATILLALIQLLAKSPFTIVPEDIFAEVTASSANCAVST